jgi:hypothetical protein
MSYHYIPAHQRLSPSSLKPFCWPALQLLCYILSAMSARPTTELKKVSGVGPRKNFSGPFSRKRSEARFVIAFGRAYAKKISEQAESRGQSHVMGRELSISGFGIADLVWIAWTSQSKSEQATSNGSSRRVRTRRATIFAFEMKLRDWRKALSQAFRYRYFADVALIVLPPEIAAKAIDKLSIFREIKVGLWSFDEKTGRIEEIFTPRRSRPFSESARQKAIGILSRELRIPPVS